MNKNIKYALVFTGGVVVGFGVCGYKVLKYALNDDGICSAIADKMTTRIKEFINGEDEIPSQNRGSRVSYRSYCKEKRKPYMDYKYDDVIFETRHDAMEAFEKMQDTIDMYGFVTMADLYGLSDIAASFTDSKYGWTNIRNCDVVNTENGYVIDLPKPRIIDYKFER
jgi:hypothetical protein